MKVLEKGRSIKNLNGGYHYEHAFEMVLNPNRMKELKEYVGEFAGALKKKWRFHIIGLPHKKAKDLYTQTFKSTKRAIISFANKNHAIMFKLGWDEDVAPDYFDFSGLRGYQKGMLNVMSAGYSSGKSMIGMQMAIERMRQATAKLLSNPFPFIIIDSESSIRGRTADYVGMDECLLHHREPEKPANSTTLVPYKELPNPNFRADFGSLPNSAKKCLPWVNRKSAPLG